MKASADANADEVRFRCSGIDGECALPTDLTDWKIAKMRSYGLASGYGMFTYLRVVHPHTSPSHTFGPLGDRMECIRCIEPDPADADTLLKSVEWLYGTFIKAEEEITRQFPHIHPQLPREAVIHEADDTEAAHLAREHKAVAIVDRDNLSATIHLWSHTAGASVKVCEMNILEGEYVAGWCSPSLLAMVLLHQESVSEIFPLP